MNTPKSSGICIGVSDRSTRNIKSVPGPLDEHRTCIEEYVVRSMRDLKAAQCVAVYFATFDAGGGAMDDLDWDEAANGAFVRNFLSGMS